MGDTSILSDCRVVPRQAIMLKGTIKPLAAGVTIPERRNKLHGRPPRLKKALAYAAIT